MKSFSKFLYIVFTVMILCFCAHTTTTFATTTTSVYGYDGLNQLAQVTNSDGTAIVYNYDAMGNRLSKTVSGASGLDTIAPTVTGFTVPAVVFNTLQVPVTVFTASDNVAVVGYIITESATAPSAGAVGWSSTAPTSYTAATTGVHTLYAYAKDAANNVSVGVSATVSIIDNQAPTVNGFTIPAVVHTLQVPVTLLTASDNVAVTGYIITENPAAPSAGAAGWSSMAPASYTAVTGGAHTLYAYAKDAAGNVSVGMGRNVFISIIASNIGVFRNGTWYIDANGDHYWESSDITISFGTAGDIPVAGDWTGSGTIKLGVFRSGSWLLDMNGNNAWDPGIDKTIALGQAGDIPVVGNWNGSTDGKDKIGVFRNGTWYLDYSGILATTGIWSGCGAPADPSKDACLSLGIAGDIPVVGDWNGDGRIKIGVFRNGTWYLDYSGAFVATGIWAGCGAPADPTKDACLTFGTTGDIPVVGDWNSNGFTKIGVFRPSFGNWYLDMNNNDQWDPNLDSLTVFGGLPGDKPIVK